MKPSSNDPARQFSDLQQNYIEQMNRLWTGAWGFQPGAGAKPAAPEDRRFAGEAWKNDPRYDLLKRTYLAYSEMTQQAIDAMPIAETAKPRLSFTARQVAEAMSPTNFFATNPEAMELAAETGGQSVLEGMSLFMEDLAKGRITMTDESAFEVGRNLAVTEGAVVFENEIMQLIQYVPRTEQVYSRPLVMIPPCINKFYILDMQPENSLVRYAVGEGHTVFLVSWRNISSAQGHLTWDDYVRLGVQQAIDVAAQIARAEQVNALGFCVGGTLLSSAAAVSAARKQDKIASLTLLTTMLDYSDTGEIGLLVDKSSVAAREQAIGRGGVLPGGELAFVFSSLRANDLIWQYVVNSYLKGKAPPAFDLLYWNADATNLAGPMFCWYVRNTYLENNLRRPGAVEVCGTPLDLSKINVPTYLYASHDDHIVPWRTAYNSRQLLGGDTTFVLGASGHIAGVINPPAKKKRNYWVAGGDGNADHWLETATSMPGSWWPDWSGWLAWHGGSKVSARRTLGNKKYRLIEPAPGRYVKQKADELDRIAVTEARASDHGQGRRGHAPSATRTANEEKRMATASIDVDEVLKQMASQAIKASGDVRMHVRELTIKAFQTRELSLSQIQHVLRNVAEGINRGAAGAGTKFDVEKAFEDALAGMDDALRKAVQASQIALQQLTDHQVDFEDSKIKRALTDLEKLEDEFLKTVKQASVGAAKPIREQWAAALQHLVPGATATGAQVEALMEQLAAPTRSLQRQRETGLRAAHLLTQNFATLASGVLMGLSEGLEQAGTPKRSKNKESQKESRGRTHS